jgi:Transposase
MRNRLKSQGLKGTSETLPTGPERRRRWSEDERHRILASVFAPGAAAADVSRWYEVSGLDQPDLPAIVVDILKSIRNVEVPLICDREDVLSMNEQVSVQS